MKAKSSPHLELAIPQLEEMESVISLKVCDVSESHLKKICVPFDFHIAFDADSNECLVTCQQKDFGTDKKQTLELFAAALAIQFHFPEAKMALQRQTELQALSPLHLSSAGQLYLSHAGFEIAVQSTERLLSPSELTQLREQFLFRSKHHQKKGA